MTRTKSILTINVVFGSLTAMSMLPSWWAVLPLAIAGVSLLLRSSESLADMYRRRQARRWVVVIYDQRTDLTPGIVATPETTIWHTDNDWDEQEVTHA